MIAQDVVHLVVFGGSLGFAGALFLVFMGNVFAELFRTFRKIAGDS